ncbi:MAG TPA: hypothetical protein VM099_08090 [Gemmatimonadaceae bacterium]|nr:hypothetical protein [Gemmatimonadaceae bacterium]
MTEKLQWVLTITEPNAAGRLIGRYASRDDAMLAGEKHFENEMLRRNSDDDELGWQMGMNGATALSDIGIYRVTRK